MLGSRDHSVLSAPSNLNPFNSGVIGVFFLVLLHAYGSRQNHMAAYVWEMRFRGREDGCPGKPIVGSFRSK